MKEHRCPDCAETDVAKFHKDRSTPTGLNRLCKVCAHERRLLKQRLNPQREWRNSSNYHARKNAATPRWLRPAQLDEMGRMEESADRLTVQTGVKHAVDHIVPLVSLFHEGRRAGLLRPHTRSGGAGQWRQRQG